MPFCISLVYKIKYCSIYLPQGEYTVLFPENLTVAIIYIIIIDDGYKSKVCGWHDEYATKLHMSVVTALGQVVVSMLKKHYIVL